MTALNLTLQVERRRAVLVGGGVVAARKGAVLRRAGLCLTVVAPQLHPSLADWVTAGEVAWLPRPYRTDDLQGAFLVVAATGLREVNRQVALDAHRLGLLVTVVDAPREGNCTFPAILQRGDLQVAVSTGGHLPPFAAAVRDELAQVLDEVYAEALDLLTPYREKLLTLGQGHTYNTHFIKKLLAAGLLQLLRRGDRVAAAALIRQHLSGTGDSPDPLPEARH